MKTNIFNITALALVFTSSFMIGKKNLKNDSFELPSISSEELVNLNEKSFTMVEAKVVNGEVIPVVDLPELEISSSYNTDYMIRAERVDGEIIPVVQLPEVTIVANK